jgi:hypothetical protein
MHKTLQEVIGIVNQGLARSSHFDVIINKPHVVVSSIFDNPMMEKIGLFCEASQLPGMNISTTGTRTFGEVREMPYEKLYDAVNLQFLVDKEMKVKVFFEEWMSGIQNPYTRTFSYYIDYVTDIDIIVYDVADYPRYTVTLYEAYPKTMGAVAVDYSSKEIMKLQITMQYKYWRTSLMTVPTGTGSEGVNETGNSPSGIKIPTSLFSGSSFLANLEQNVNMQTWWTA